jgi:nucleosome binding factor SPN SPT16 subunit
MTRDMIDIIFSNMKHLIFQKCDKGSHVVMIHIHLKHQILLNKKKTSDISFYTEAIEASTALSKNRRNMYDPDEMDEEQRERKMRRLLNKNLLKFCKTVHNHVDGMKGVSFDIEQPYSDLSFMGAPHKEMVRLQPTVDSLVNVTETPPFVVTLADIEHVHFEGVLANKKNFDMAIVMKDKTVVHKVGMIPMKELGMFQKIEKMKML